MARLTEQEQQEVIRYIEANKPLPDKFRFLLFEEKREVELVWNDKTSEVCNIVLPFQIIEQVDEPRAERSQMSLFDLNLNCRCSFDIRGSVDFDFESNREIIRVKNEDSGEWEEHWTGDYIFENEWQSFRTKKDRSLELVSVFHECESGRPACRDARGAGRRKLAVKVVDIFGNDTMTIVEVNVGGKK